ncbi:MAG: tetratricopeptide repeat protein [Oscillospiraceae bacterium]|nr:tetratricopeptide repeat protein [Oscillospiraceae bacterium]
MKQSTANKITITVVAVLAAALVGYYLYDVLYLGTPYTENLFRTIAILCLLIASLIRRLGSSGRLSLDIYEKEYKEELGYAFNHKPLLRKKLLCACRLYNESNYRKALKYLYELLGEAEFERDAVPVLLMIALCYTDVGVNEEAIAAYFELLKLDKNHAQAHSNLGLLLMREGENKTAIQHFDRSIELKPDNYYAYSNRANCYFRMMNYDLAIRDAKQALEYKNNGAEAASLLTIIYALMGDEENKKHYYHISIAAGKRPEDMNEAIEYFLSENNIPQEEMI